MNYYEIKELFDKIAQLAGEITKTTRRLDRISVEDLVDVLEDIHRTADTIQDLTCTSTEVLEFVSELDDELNQAKAHIESLGAYGEDCRACSNELNCLMNK